MKVTVPSERGDEPDGSSGRSKEPGPGLGSFGSYVKARHLFDLVVHDLTPLARDFRCGRLISQQFASADSICANIEEGYGRGTKKEFTQFLTFARGSAWETRRRYKSLSFCLAADVIADRVSRCGEVIGIITTTIPTLRR